MPTSADPNPIFSLLRPYHDQASAQGRDFDALWAWLNAQRWKDDELKEAIAEFSALVPVPRNGQLRQAYADIFLDWFLLDRPLSQAAGAQAEQPPARAWHPDSPLAAARFEGFLVEKVTPEKVALRGLATKEALTLTGATELELAPGQLLVGRLLPHGQAWSLGAFFTVLSPEEGQAFSPDEIDGYAVIDSALAYVDTFGFMNEG